MKYRKYRENVSNENIRKTAEADVARRKINALKNLITDINLDKSSHEPNVTNNFSTQTLEDERQDEIIKKLLEAPLLTDRHWNDFVMLFDQIHPNFFDRIDEKWNGLTASEIRLLALTRLDIDNKKMALMLGVGPNAIRQVKSRLRKKIDLGSEKNFEEVIINI
jgi:DNA-binding CsgD family transcriptional regulator